ncbi:MAG: HAMP domain-containing sensor histidine kinase, partial [Bacteroidota bacterium]
RISNTLMWLSKLLLLGFLGYWLHYTYQEEKVRLVNDHHFDLAKVLLEEADINFNEVLENAISHGENLNQTQFKVFIKEGKSKKDSFQYKVIEQDRIIGTGLQKGMDYSAGVRNSINIIDTSFQLDNLDSFPLEINSQRNILMLPNKGEHQLGQQALVNILPQICFAILLFSVSILALWLTRQYYQKNQVLLENKHQFISNMAHELRTPVTTIGVALEAIQNRAKLVQQDKLSAYLQTSRNEVKRLGHLIEQVLSVAKGELQTNTLSFQTIDLKTIATQAIQSMQPQIDAKQAEVHLHFSNDPVLIKGDAIHLLNVITNLIDNALKYNPNHTALHFNLEQSMEGSLFSLRDDGVGIAKRYQSRLFEQFFRVPTGDQYNVKGYGLGLSYVQSIVEAHGGTVSLSSKEKQGTTIKIKLPNVEG